ncbi:MAG: hypothetical protein K8J08_13300, partial [Thermoanaerobaculia bacterium]|nr:hypothetical protein [Thermoanaerobaculia bacterium]
MSGSACEKAWLDVPLRWLPFLLMILAVVMTVAPLPAAEMSVLLNSDDDTATGCTVVTVDGDFDGVESVLITVVDDVTDEVTAVTLSDCVGGVLAPPTVVMGLPLPWPVGVGLGEAGSDVVETALPLGAPLIGTTLRMGFVSDNLM